MRVLLVLDTASTDPEVQRAHVAHALIRYGSRLLDRAAGNGPHETYTDLAPGLTLNAEITAIDAAEAN